MDVEHVVGAPHPRLRPFVTRYSGYRMRTEPGVHRGLPSRSLTLVVTMDGTVDLAHGRFATLCGGLHDEAVLITHDGFQHGVQCSLTPLGARAFFGLPAGELAGTAVGLDALDAPAGELRERLQEAATWTDRFACLDEVFGRLVRPVRQQVELAWAWQRIAEGAPVGEIAAEVGWSRQHLSARFAAEYGLTPKVMGRVMRFELANRMLRGQTRPTLTEVAAACGYTDQAHFNRDWRALCGATPTEWIATELPFVQGSEAGAVAEL
ncbi:helix-turn-helix domain-containing protein [Lentzea flava]|uniref:AraC family transcriptional regulator n=1 Tax=Lentzea flava TaxID=103732 RepID=A0ABQ2UL61_9PSEU|nr:helix-turn-helix domain-containing protein [Lentzea flava]MCP2200244.1 Helix-turn-helix domain-containing protein [Lentzea flava]GGU40933.1 AraC family transcriptional regulator [Lentzea flava]